ncbi:MAG TPA: hypothetical protein PK280_02665 [Planctomycetota bacterium]|nr:hypothetical protein [Planctomycetota bacterium]
MMRPTVILAVTVLFGCGREPQVPAPAAPRPAAAPAPARPARDYKLVHVFVALCDNRNQGIVKVPAHLGDGQDPAGNLYWGAAYGVKTFLGRSGGWEEVPLADRPRRPEILARALFRSRSGPAVRILAEAYDGAKMEAALTDFLRAAAGTLGAEAPADLVCFVGHNGLMDLRLAELPKADPGAKPSAAVVLACKSQAYFTEPLRATGCRALVLTTGFMAPEAYTLEAIVAGWAAGEPPERVRARAAEAYALYQKCGRSAAAKLFAAE